MNSLVVLFSVMALVAAKPSALLPSGILSYTAPAVALAPAAVSHQSRLDIKSSPAVISEKIVLPYGRTVVANPIITAPAAYGLPAAYAAPTAFAAPIAYSAQAAYVAPAAYSAPVAVGPAAPLAPLPAAYKSVFFSPAISSSATLLKTAELKPIAMSKSKDAAASKLELPVAPTETPEVAAARAAHLEAKAFEESRQISSPAVLSTIAAAPILNAANIAYNARVASAYTSGFFSPAIAPAAALLKTAEFKPIALSNFEDVAIGKPELPVAPTETPEVAAARAAHLEAKALEESHQIHKRAVKYLASAPVLSTYSATPFISSPVYTAPIIRPLAVSHPVITTAYNIHAY